jgi:hypothetical protein
MAVVVRDAAKVLEGRGYGVVHTHNPAMSRYTPVNLVGIRGEHEILHVKLKISLHAFSDDAAIARFCAEECRLLRRMMTVDPGEFEPHFEIWVSLPSGGFSGIEVLPESLKAVAYG